MSRGESSLQDVEVDRAVFGEEGDGGEAKVDEDLCSMESGGGAKEEREGRKEDRGPGQLLLDLLVEQEVAQAHHLKERVIRRCSCWQQANHHVARRQIAVNDLGEVHLGNLGADSLQEGVCESKIHISECSSSCTGARLMLCSSAKDERTHRDPLPVP